MNTTFSHAATTSRITRKVPTDANSNNPALPLSYRVIAELAVGYSMVIAMLAYVIVSSGAIDQII